MARFYLILSQLQQVSFFKFTCTGVKLDHLACTETCHPNVTVHIYTHAVRKAFHLFFVKVHGNPLVGYMGVHTNIEKVKEYTPLTVTVISGLFKGTMT